MDALDWSSAKTSVLVAVGCLGFFLILMLLSALVSRSPEVQTSVKELVQVSAQLGETAHQDKDAALALQHSTQALAYLSVARRLASDDSIFAQVGVRCSELERELLDKQAASISRLGRRETTLTNVTAGYVNL
jgi:hypothetical protein